MYYALDENKRKISSYCALKGKEYFCPICGGKVILKSGEIKLPHFAHETGECFDTWNYDMSEWHKTMQEYFDDEYREVVCKLNKQMHRADILKDGVVLEFQHSPISSKEFLDRNEFYLSCGYKMIWIFDVSDEYENGNLSFFKSQNGNELIRWKYPKQVLKFSYDLSEYNKNFAIFLYWKHDDAELIEKVIWSSKNNYGEYDFRVIKISDDYYELEHNMDLSYFFLSTKDKLMKYLENKKPYALKKIKTKGFRKEHYICPRRNNFGLTAFGETGCAYCKFCGALEKKGQNINGSSYDVYCCFPNQVNEETDPKYELYESEAPIF